MWKTSGTPLSLSAPLPAEVLLPFGAKLTRIFIPTISGGASSPMFLHVNLLHLIVNMYCLWILVPTLKKLYGSAKFVVFWVVPVWPAGLAVISRQAASGGNPIAGFHF